MYFHFVLISTVAKKGEFERKNPKKFLQIPLLEEKKNGKVFFCFLISLSGKTPVTFTLINACVAKFKAVSYNLYPAAAGTSPSLKH